MSSYNYNAYTPDYGCSERFFDATYFDGSRTSHRQAWSWNSNGHCSPYTRGILRGLSWYLFSNFGPVTGPINCKELYSVGANGISLRAATGNKGWDYLATTLMRDWFKVLDIGGRFDLTDISTFASMYADIANEFILFKTRTSSGFPGIQLVEPYCIGATGAKDEDDPMFYDGLWMQGAGRRVTHYRLRTDDYGGYRDVPADAVIYYGEYASGMHSAYRPSPTLAPILNDMIDAKETNSGTKMMMKINSLIPAVIEGQSKDGQARVAPVKTMLSTGEEREVDLNIPRHKVQVETLFKGTIPELPPGTTLKTWQQDRPGNGFIAYNDLLLNNFSSVIKVPLPVWWNPASLTGSSAKFPVNQFGRVVNDRTTHIVNKVIKGIWEHGIKCFIDMGELPYNENWYRFYAQRPPLINLDINRDRANDREDLKMGIINLERIFAEQGLDDWQGEISQWGKEQKFMVSTVEGIKGINTSPLYISPAMVKAEADAEAVEAQSGALNENE